ncbi:MAG: FISUMP domain-containing protein, partial [Bacteroidales bacterium]|nr:FISUMP domain-containing protein [Bacteroidales bacterium]
MNKNQKTLFAFTTLFVLPMGLLAQNLRPVNPCPTELSAGYQGVIYSTGLFGHTCWTRENMQNTHYSDGATIPFAKCYNNDETYLSTYGRLYDWTSATRLPAVTEANAPVQGICPDGWYLPIDSDYDALTNNAGGEQYIKSPQYWVVRTSDTSHAHGFNAIPAGYFNPSRNNYEKMLADCYFWTSTSTTVLPSYCHLGYGCPTLTRTSINSGYGFSARCVKYYYVPTLNDEIVFSNSSYTGTTVTAKIANDGNAPCVAKVEFYVDSAMANRVLCIIANVNNTTGVVSADVNSLTDNTLYYVKLTVENIIGTDEITSSFRTHAYCPTNAIRFNETGDRDKVKTIKDVENNEYNVVQIGGQCWMAANLRTTKYADNTEIALGAIPSTDVAYRYYPNEEESNVATYGYLYNWNAAMHNEVSAAANSSEVQGICPTGWHMPSEAEWGELFTYCGGIEVAGGKLKSTAGWNDNGNGTDDYGFSAMPTGGYSGRYTGFGQYVCLWSASDSNNISAFFHGFGQQSTFVGSYLGGKNRAFSVRCLRDKMPIVTTAEVTNIGRNTAICGGNVVIEGESYISARGVCWSTAHNPTIADSKTIDGRGTGSFTSTLTGLNADTTYYVRAYATSEEGTAYGAEISFATSFSCTHGATVTDVDNNTYNTVQIGTQCWMKENLRTTRYADNTPIEMGITNRYDFPYRYYYNNQEEIGRASCR